jgi:hypothetical protein
MELIRPPETGSPSTRFHFDPIGLADAEQDAPIVTDWPWEGFLAAGEITLLTSQWKAGKTTLLSIFLARLDCGGSLLGRPVRATKAIVVSEEAQLPWRQRHQRLHFGQSLRLMSRPFHGKPSFSEWDEFVDRLAALGADDGYGIVVIDTLGNLFPRGVEHNADCMQRALASLRKLTDRGIAVWLLHHPRKGRALEGQLARGTSALPAFVDILLELHPLKSTPADDRRRWLRGYSRHEETPRKLLIEWSRDGRDYLLRNADVDEDFLRGWRRLRIVLEDADDKLRRQDILEQWPADYVTPSKATLWRWLDRAVDEGLVLREGEGRRNSPFRYFLAEKLVQWLDEPLQFIDEPDMYALAMQRAKARAPKENHESTK